MGNSEESPCRSLAEMTLRRLDRSIDGGHRYFGEYLFKYVEMEYIWHSTYKEEAICGMMDIHYEQAQKIDKRLNGVRI